MDRVDIQMTVDFNWAADPAGDTVHCLPAGRLCVVDAEIAAAVVAAGAGHVPKIEPPSVSALVESYRREYGDLPIDRVPGTNAIDGTIFVEAIRRLTVGP